MPASTDRAAPSAQRLQARAHLSRGARHLRAPQWVTDCECSGDQLSLFDLAPAPGTPSGQQ